MRNRAGDIIISGDDQSPQRDTPMIHEEEEEKTGPILPLKPVQNPKQAKQKKEKVVQSELEKQASNGDQMFQVNDEYD